MKTKCLFTLTLTAILVVVVFTAFAEEPKVTDRDIYIPTTVSLQSLKRERLPCVHTYKEKARYRAEELKYYPVAREPLVHDQIYPVNQDSNQSVAQGAAE